MFFNDNELGYFMIYFSVAIAFQLITDFVFPVFVCCVSSVMYFLVL